MLRNAREYKVYLPLTYPNGEPIEGEKFTEVKRRLLDVFGGVTVIRQANYLEGLWLAEEEVIPDQIVIYTSVDLLHPGMENEMFIVVQDIYTFPQALQASLPLLCLLSLFSQEGY